MFTCCWANYERRWPLLARPVLPLVLVAVAQAGKEVNDLDGLAQAHLVSKNPTSLLLMQLPQPLDRDLKAKRRDINAIEL